MAAALADGVNSPADAWRFIIEFSQQWACPLAADDGFSGVEVADAEARLGTRLPRVLREALMLFGRKAKVITGQDPFDGPGDLAFKQYGDDLFLVFRPENQHCWAWCIGESDLSHDDPPVVLVADRRADPVVTQLFPRASVAYVHAILSERLMLQLSSHNLVRIQRLTPELMEEIEAAFPRIDLLTSVSPWEPQAPGVRWYARPGCLIEATEDPGYGGEAVLIAQTEDDLQHALAALPAPWPSRPVFTALSEPYRFSAPPDPWATTDAAHR